MNRPWKIWLAFALCAAVLLGVMSWVSFTALRLDRLQLEAARQAELEERARLALWRMDSWLAALIVEESARPAAAYESFHAAERAYTKAFSQLKQGDVLVPSPLLGFVSDHILLHFQLFPDGRLTSPQALAGQQRALAEANNSTLAQVDTAAQRLAALREILDQPASSREPERRSPTRRVPTSQVFRAGSETGAPMTGSLASNRDFLFRQAELPLVNVAANLQPLGPALAGVPAQAAPAPAQESERQGFRNEIEMNSRANVFQQSQQRVVTANLKQTEAQAASVAPALAGSEGLFKAVWLADALVLARRVSQGRSFAVQGCWLNWPHLRAALLASVKDLFPDADLQPTRDTHGERNARLLAALPVKLLTGPAPFESSAVWTPLRFSLALAWGCVLVAGLAVALLLHGTLSLSERRAAFVSAVTHELRTPLTTFKMYSEMLADDMVPDAAKRKSYLQTLCSEANRLSHLVENVLAYARLERGSARDRVERIALGDLLGRVKPRLEQRAEQAGMSLAADADAQTAAAIVHVDVSAVEQILFNLVDNACKYAAPVAVERIIHLEALPDNGRFAMLRVRDHGQGISAEGAHRLFQPFSKSAHEAAHTAPGVGLGLALCRRLSRSMGGDLKFAPGVKGGACFVLRLPVSAAS